MVQAGVQVVVMEVSAHALDMHRLDGMTFECGCYTNLSQDHLDYFGTMENYFQCKKAFFTSGMAKNAAINADDERAAELLRDVTIPHMTYGIAAEADLFARDIEITENGVSFELRLRNAEYIQINLRMTGMFNVYNALSAAACALILGVSPENVRAGLESIHSVPGRIEMLPTNTPYRVILDYAHAPDALSNILRTCRTFTKKRLIALFGCGGDRDKGKRPIMGRIGGELADLCILTSDNPRTEDPMEILREIEEGIKETTGEYVVIENRRDAIRHALSWVSLQALDCVVMFIGALAMMFSIDRRLALALACVTPPLFILTRGLSKHARPLFFDIRNSLAEMNSMVEENIEGNRVVKAFVREDLSLIHI